MGRLKRRWRLIQQVSFAKKRKAMLGPFARAILFTTKNGSFLAPVEDIEIGKRIGTEGEYDLNELRQIEPLIDSCSVVYVIGTHIGLLLVPIARKVKTVIGYEANPQTFELVQINVELNKLKNVKLYNYAVGDRDDEIEFYVNVANSGGSKIKPKKDQFIYTFDNPSTVSVKMKAVDEHAIIENLPAADMIIMDIEGAEYFALKGMRQTLSGSKSLYIEFIPHHLQNVAGVTAIQFFELIIPHYTRAKFMKDPERIFDLVNDLASFTKTVDQMMGLQKDDNILFYKDE